jgi:hypothetical protein
MKRNLPDLLSFPGKTLNIGSSPNDTWKIPGATALGRPLWKWPQSGHIFEDRDSISTIHCYHFLEHLNGEDAISFLRECERVMIPGASVLNFCMPYYNSSLQAECLDHKSAWCIDSFRNLFDNSGFDIAGPWKLSIHFQLICGVAERNMCLIGQLVKDK